MSEEVLNNLFELRNLEDDKARKYTLYRKIEKYIINLQQENKQLKELCNKYEEEHKTTFDTWLKGQKVLTELETALKDHKEIKEKTNTKEYYIEVDEVLDKIQKLKEKYK